MNSEKIPFWERAGNEEKWDAFAPLGKAPALWFRSQFLSSVLWQYMARWDGQRNTRILIKLKEMKVVVSKSCRELTVPQSSHARLPIRLAVTRVNWWWERSSRFLATVCRVWHFLVTQASQPHFHLLLLCPTFADKYKQMRGNKKGRR